MPLVVLICLMMMIMMAYAALEFMGSDSSVKEKEVSSDKIYITNFTNHNTITQKEL
jgi:predicted S18 family serine protease